MVQQINYTDNLRQGTDKINDNFTEVEDKIQQIDDRVDTIISDPTPGKDPELVDIRTPDPSYTPLEPISTAGGMTRDMQQQFVAHKAETAYTNYLINGAFDIWQRGTNFAPTINHTYTADRWRLSRSGSNIAGLFVSQVSGERSQYAMAFGRSNGDSNTSQYAIGQQIEQSIAAQLRGEKVTLSLWARKGSGFTGASARIRLYIYTSDLDNPAIVSSGKMGSSDTVDNINRWVDLTDELQRHTVTGTLSDTINSLLVVISVEDPSGVAGDNDYVHIEQVQLIAGDDSIPFQPRLVASELLLCQRYYQKSYALDRVPGSIVDSGREVLISQNTQYFGRSKRVQLFMPMRVTPTVTLYSNKSGEPGKVYNNTQSVDIYGDAGNVMDNSFMAGALSGSDISVGDTLTFHWTADAEI